MNVTLEHLEFHKDFETYRSDKANLFRALDLHDHVKVIAGEKIKVPSIGIVNLEDPSASYFISATKKNVYVGYTQIVDGVPEGWEIKSIIDVYNFKYGKSHSNADIRGSIHNTIKLA